VVERLHVLGPVLEVAGDLLHTHTGLSELAAHQERTSILGHVQQRALSLVDLGVESSGEALVRAFEHLRDVWEGVHWVQTLALTLES